MELTSKEGFTKNESASLRYKVAIRFAIQNDVRFISHHDTMRMFERALARTDLPVRFSEGFNPRPKLSLPLPRPVGIATLADVLVVEFTGEVAPEMAVTRLSAQMPESVALEDAWIPAGRRPIQPESATYSLALTVAEVPTVSERLSEILASESWLVKRDDGPSGPGRQFDLRRALIEVGLDEQSLHSTVRISGTGSVRPGEVLASLGLKPEQWQHRVTRTAIGWRTEP